MKFEKTLNELDAEITKGKIQPNKVFINGNVPKGIPPEWAAVLKEILNILKSKGLLDSFGKDQEPIDITGRAPKGNIFLTADTGEKYKYNVDSKKLFKVV